MKHTLINFHKRKRNNECQASETLSYIVYAEGGGGYFNIGKSWKSLGFPTATMSTNDMNHQILQYNHRDAVANQANRNDVNSVSVVRHTSECMHFVHFRHTR